ncbi:dienelactone hydrolase family protein [Salix suchowensis]|nr:dienelactone hydrolase family protein [Salix suchowensis]
MDSPSFFIASTVPHSFPSLKSSVIVKFSVFGESTKLTPGYGGGTVQELGGLETGPSDSNLAILLLSDVIVAAAGFFVVVPDFLYGDPVDLSKCKMVIGALKTKGMNSIGAARFCWGDEFVSSNVAVKLASSNAFLGAEIDRASPPEQLKEFRELLSAKSQAMGPQPQV